LDAAGAAESGEAGNHTCSTLPSLPF